MKKILISLLSFIIFIYLGACAYLYNMQEALIFPGAYSQANAIQSHQKLENTIEPLELITDNEVILKGAKANNNSDTLLIYYSGNSENAFNMLNILNEFKNIDIITYHYRGYVTSQGKPTAKDILNDAVKIYDSHANDYENIILLGRSLGTGVATYIASKRDVTTVLLITPYDSIQNVAKKQYPIMPIKELLVHNIDSIQYVQNIKIPVSILMVKDDLTIPNQHTKNLIKYIKNLKNFKIVKNTTHNDIIKTNDFKQFIRYNINIFINDKDIQ